jgi:hypothetical protein
VRRTPPSSPPRSRAPPRLLGGPRWVGAGRATPHLRPHHCWPAAARPRTPWQGWTRRWGSGWWGRGVWGWRSDGGPLGHHCPRRGWGRKWVPQVGTLPPWATSSLGRGGDGGRDGGGAHGTKTNNNNSCAREEGSRVCTHAALAGPRRGDATVRHKGPHCTDQGPPVEPGEGPCPWVQPQSHAGCRAQSQGRSRCQQTGSRPAEGRGFGWQGRMPVDLHHHLRSPGHTGTHGTYRNTQGHRDSQGDTQADILGAENKQGRATHHAKKLNMNGKGDSRAVRGHIMRMRDTG